MSGKRLSGLDARIPDTGLARDAYDVACTAIVLLRKPMPDGIGSYAPARHAVTLHRISGMLHRLAEAECNVGLTPRQQTREKNLQAQASDIATHYGMRAYFQGDPRGCSLYLLDPNTPDDDYNRGHAVTRLGR